MKKKYLFKFELKKRLQNISITDILGLFIIFFIVAITYFFSSRKTEYLNITIRLFNQDTPEYTLDSNQTKAWYIEQIKKGKAQKTIFGETLIEIVDVYSYPNAYVYNDVYVTLKIKAVQNKVTKQFVYEGSPLLIHDVKSFRVQDLLLSGEVIDLNNAPRETKKFKVTFELFDKRLGYDFVNNSESMIRGVNQYVADLVVEGLTIKDSENNELVKIKTVEKNPGTRIIAGENGLITIKDPERVRVVIYTDLTAEKINNHYYYRKEEPLIVDEVIYLTFDGITVAGTITSIEPY